MTVSVIDLLLNGGCYWQRQPQSPGHSMAIPEGTSFRIIAKPTDRQSFVYGKCSGGCYVLDSGERFTSADKAVKTVRETELNAFLYIHFLVRSQWVEADALRHRDTFRCDEADELALELALGKVREKLRQLHKTLGSDDLIRKAAEVVKKYPVFLEVARRRLTALDLADVSRSAPTLD